MKVIRPIPITSSKVLSSTATELYSAWSGSTTYALGDRVIYGENVYESLVASNLDKVPDTSANDWLDMGANNKMSMFDTQVNTQTTATESLTVVFRPGSTFNAVAFLNVVGSQITVTVKDSVDGNIVYTDTMSLDYSTDNVIDWYTYFFEDFDFLTEAFFQNIPPYSGGVVEVVITTGPGNPVAIGAVCVGSVIDLGDTQYGLGYGIRDYSIKETDEFGMTRFVERNFSKKMSPKLLLANTRLNYVTKTLQNLRAVPTVYIGVDDSKFQSTVIFGFLKDWNIEISYPNHSLISLEVDGLI